MEIILPKEKFKELKKLDETGIIKLIEENIEKAEETLKAERESFLNEKKAKLEEKLKEIEEQLEALEMFYEKALKDKEFMREMGEK